MKKKTDLERLRRSAVEIREGRLTLLNRTCQFGNRIDWTSAVEERLWRYNLHYGDYLRGLAVLHACRHEDEWLELLQCIMGDWINQNPCGHGVGWHAYPVSLRLVNWLYAWDLFRDDPAPFPIPDLSPDRFFDSVYTQAAFLADNLEHDVGGNHLLENAKALIIAGLCVQGSVPQGWLGLGLSILTEELRHQVLADGAH